MTLSFERIAKFIAEANALDEENLDLSSVEAAWKENKARFIEKWGGTSIRSEEEIVFTISREEFETRLHKFYNALKTYIDNTILVEDIVRYVNDNWLNVACGRTVSEFSDSGCLKKTIPAGIRIAKGFKYFMLEDNNMLKKIQEDYFSEIVDRYSLRGKLVASVDPKDFVTMSPCGGRWHSCSDISNDYRTAALSYMTDPTTMLLFVESTEAEKYMPEQKQKGWRVVVYVSEDMKCAAFGPEYGLASFESYIENKQLEEFLNEVLGNGDDSVLLKAPIVEPSQNPIKSATRIYTHGTFLNPTMVSYPKFNEKKTAIFEISEFKSVSINRFINNISGYHYNDITKKSPRLPGGHNNRGMFMRLARGYNDKPLDVGSNVKCLYPGCERMAGYTTMFFCIEHEYEHGQACLSKCKLCDNIMCDEDIYYFNDDNVYSAVCASEEDWDICDDCYTSASTCGRCGMKIFGEEYYDEKRDIRLCSECYEDFWFEKGVK